VDVTVAVATFGDLSWVDLAETRAIPSAQSHGVPVVHAHGNTLHDARNAALSMVDTEWVCHLDADDELDPGYFTAMSHGTADVRAPSVMYVVDGEPKPAWMPRVAGHMHRCKAACLTEGNWLVVGSLVRADLVRSVGGWRDFDWSEDWDLWLRCHLAGATFEAIRPAIYRAHARPDSRNRGADRRTKLAAHHAILAANGIAA
jgi:glycosyltransferase involved in cell wall biosynthesis